MEGAPINVPSSLNALIWSPGWNSNEAINKFQDEVDGHLKGGDAGVLIVTKQAATKTLIFPKSESIALQPGQLLGLPQQRLFDGDRRMALSLALVQRAEKSQAQINSATAKQNGLAMDRKINISLNGSTIDLTLVINEALPDGALLLPNNFVTQQQFPMASLPAVVEVNAL
jgi:NADH-quinone oxidoreductase subunit G